MPLPSQGQALRRQASSNYLNTLASAKASLRAPPSRE